MSAGHSDLDNESEISWEKHKQVTLALFSFGLCNNQQIIWAVKALKFLYILQAVIKVN